MARAPVMAAGGIVLRRGPVPLVAVVRQRKRNEWVLPKGKLDDGETPKEAAHREVLEETGHDVAIHEFLGTLVYQSGGRSKVVHFWRMEADGGPVRKLTNDIKAVDWLTLAAIAAARADAVERRRGCSFADTDTRRSSFRRRAAARPVAEGESLAARRGVSCHRALLAGEDVSAS
ncbi:MULTISPECIES: NUDIX hydrolase [Bradyrhizobium]|uniref:NUDIX hydrolase n=1 Tax=Bradyrhizobium TaxID=374 RepID=UPI001FED5AA7|nr:MULTISPECIES: NUDIX domain-containing protein [Bradyrhizobium]